VSRPLLLDLFCGAGGAAVGYHRAGFDVVGVDILPQPRYPFEFIQGDALTPPVDFAAFDVVHASPPCQAYTVANNIHQADHPNLVPPTRQMLRAVGLPWVIENVPGSPLHVGQDTLFDPGVNGVLVCGRAFPELNVKRHRLFESNVPLRGTTCPPGHPGDWLLIFGHTVLERGYVAGKAKGGGNVIRRKHTTTERGREAMGISWMNRDELSEAIPPAYTEFVGRALLDVMECVA
jgi:DNA (cytosine-5)-methyltransferase 1